VEKKCTLKKVVTEMIQIDVRHCKKCAFCKHWYDPTNSAIAPKYPQRGVWEYDQKARKKCLKTNLEKTAASVCGRYEPKLTET